MGISAAQFSILDHLYKEAASLVSASQYGGHTASRLQDICRVATHFFRSIDATKLDKPSADHLQTLLNRLSHMLKTPQKWEGIIKQAFMKKSDQKLLEAIIKALQTELKQIKKLLQAQLLPLSEGSSLLELLFEDHIIERVLFFNHKIAFHKGVPCFLYTEQRPLRDELPEDNLRDIKDFYETYKGEGLTLRLFSSEDAEYQTYKLDDLSLVEFKKLIHPQKGLFRIDDITLLMPSKQLSVKELEEEGALVLNEKGQYNISSDFQYTSLGFTNQKAQGWKKLLPFRTSDTPPKKGEFLVEITTHVNKKEGLSPGVFTNQGHVSVKLTSETGNEYAVGFFPSDPEADIGWQFAELVSPDPYIFKPPESVATKTTSLKIPNKEAFNRLIRWIEELNTHEERDSATDEITKSDLKYHQLFNNCATFAKELKTFVMKELHATIVSPKQNRLILALRQLLVDMQKLIILIAVHLPYIKHSYHQTIMKGVDKPAKIARIILPIDLGLT